MRSTRPLDEPTGAWDIARVLLLGAAAALLAAAWFALRPVENPGVQDCGPPLRFIVESTDNVVVPIGVPEAPPNAPELRAQEPCSELVVRPLEQAGLFTIACVGLGLLGAALGLLDDRIQLRRAPRFEDLVRERPADAPVRAFDPIPTSPDELADDLPPVETTELALLGAGALVGIVGVAALVDAGATLDALGQLTFAGLAAIIGLAVVTRLVAGGVRWLGADGSSPLVSGPAADGGSSDRLVGWLAEVAATGWAARARPETGVYGIDLHHLVRTGAADTELAERRVGVMVTAALAVHVLVVGGLVVGGPPDVPEPDARAYLLLVGAVALGLLLGLAKVARVLRAQAVLPSWTGVRNAVAPEGRVIAAVAAGGALLQVGLEVLTLHVAIGAVGGSLELSVVALAWVLAVSVGAASPFPGGAGLTEGALALLLWRWGLGPGEAVAAVIACRVVTWWLPALPGLGAVRWLQRSRWQ